MGYVLASRERIYVSVSEHLHLLENGGGRKHYSFHQSLVNEPNATQTSEPRISHHSISNK